MGVHRALTHFVKSNVASVDAPEPIGTVFSSASSVLTQPLSASAKQTANVLVTLFLIFPMPLVV